MTEREALKLALKALEIGLALIEDFGSTEQLNAQHKAITAIYEALAQPEHGWTPERIAGMARLKEAQDKKLAQPEQHQDWCASLTQMLMSMPPKPAPCNCKPKPEYLAFMDTPQRTWVGLTEAQCGVLWKTNMTPFEYYQAIEAKLKEKNT